MLLKDLVASVDALLTPEQYHDYAPNGLQVQGRREVHRVVTGVTASLALIERAKQLDADAVFVHHGWFWKHEDPRIIGVRHRRIAELMSGAISLVAYHLPLDDHPEIGNNALFGKALGFEPVARFGDNDLGWLGHTSAATSAVDLREKISAILGRQALLVGPADKSIRRIAWCTGAAQDMIEDAALAGADCFISGEICERTTHLARELDISYLSCGHHATERYGIQALGNWIAQQHGLEVTFIDIDNPA